MSAAAHLPVELQLEVVAHSDDAATIHRCAAVSKALRAAILGPSFRPRRRHALRAAVGAGFGLARLLGVSDASLNDARGGGGFDLARLLGVSDASLNDGGGRFGQARLLGVSDASLNDGGGRRPSRSFHLDAGILRSFELVSSRDGLLVLWRKAGPELRVHDTFGGRATRLPHMDVAEGKWGAGGIYPPALLAVGLLSFDVFVMDACLRARTYSSTRFAWGPIRVVKPPSAHNHWCAIEKLTRSSPAVVGRKVHWICRSTRSGDAFMLALHVDALVATSIELPPGACHGSCALAATAERDALSVVVAETQAISLWTFSTNGWCRDVVVSMPVTPDDVGARIRYRPSISFVGFGKMTGSVLLWMEGVGLVQLNLGTEEAIVCTSERDKSRVTSLSFHEIDLAALF